MTRERCWRRVGRPIHRRGRRPVSRTSTTRCAEASPCSRRRGDPRDPPAPRRIRTATPRTTAAESRNYSGPFGARWSTRRALAPLGRARGSSTTGCGGVRLGLLFECTEPRHCPGAQFCRIACDRGFSGLRDTRDTTVERSDELAQILLELPLRHRHGRPPSGETVRRASFHTSPHSVQRE
jgi:hypothetical protein